MHLLQRLLEPARPIGLGSVSARRVNRHCGLQVIGRFAEELVEGSLNSPSWFLLGLPKEMKYSSLLLF